MKTFVPLVALCMMAGLWNASPMERNLVPQDKNIKKAPARYLKVVQETAQKTPEERSLGSK